VKEDGTITLLLNQEFTAADKTRGELEKEIRKRYVPDLFKALTVNVEPLNATQFYYVDGEVKMPDRQVYISRMTVLKAIASAKGFTDFAKKTGVVLTRLDGRKITINCIKAQKDPKLDLEVFPGDKVWVPRRVNPFWQ
jgi:polysaccharide export outer membrane protein